MKIGDIGYACEPWSKSVIKSEIVAIEPVDNIKEAFKLNGIEHVDRNGNSTGKAYGSCHKLPQDVYPTIEAAYAAIDAEDKTILTKYCEEIKTVKDLLSFAMNHCLQGEEYTDYNARKAYVIRSKELLGVDIT